MRNKLISSLVIVALFSSVLAACSSKDNGTGNEASTSADDSGKNKKISINWFDGTWEGQVPGPDSDAVKKINEKFNVEFKPQYIPYDTYEEKLAVKMASGDIPDVIGMEFVNANYLKWAQQGAFLPLDEFLQKYDSTKEVPDYTWDSLKVDGKVYGVPMYFSAKGGKKPVIRKDWLDKLHLKMPTNYEELKQVIVAFTNNDPDGNGKDDTIGLGLSKGIYYDPSFSAYYSNEIWYNKNSSGQYIPGIIADGNKEKVTFLADLQKQGILKQDWAVTSYKDVFKAFNAGKVGVWYEQPGGSGDNGILFDVLKQNAPDAEVVPIPPFKAPDGSQGFTINGSWYTMYMISAKLKDQPEKVNRILEMIDFFHRPVDFDQRNPQNEYFDWLYGGEGKGYKMENGIAQLIAENRSNVAPSAYITVGGWLMNDEDLFAFPKMAKTPEEQAFQQSLADLLHGSKFYVNPTSRIISPILMEKFKELHEYVSGETTKMIFGERPLSDWDKMVQEYMDKGGKDMIDEVNKTLEANKIQGEWK